MPSADGTWGSFTNKPYNLCLSLANGDFQGLVVASEFMNFHKESQGKSLTPLTVTLIECDLICLEAFL